MSTNPEDRLVNVLSHWLARHADDEELRHELTRAGTAGLGDEGRKAVEELRQELDGRHGHGELERTGRKTLEALSLGVDHYGAGRTSCARPHRRTRQWRRVHRDRSRAGSRRLL